MKARHYLLSVFATAAATALSLATSARAAVIFSEDFDDITVTGANLTTATTGNAFNTTVATGADFTAIVRDDPGNLFGAGTGNHYLELVDASTTSGVTVRKQSIAGMVASGVAQLSFDFYDPVGRVDDLTEDTAIFTLDSGSAATAAVSLRLLNNPGVSSVVFFNAAVDPVNYVTVAPYSEGVKHSVVMVLNYGASAVTYASGTQSLAAQSYHVWLDGVPVGTDYAFFNSVTSSNRLMISISTLARTAAQNVDNVVLDNTLTVAPPPHPGDFDNDGDVDGADFVAWQTHFPTATGATLVDGDADGDGDVDGADFVVWQTNFPFTPGPGASPVPEPNSFILFGLALTGLVPACLRRRK